MDKKIITLGIDSASRSNGFAVFEDGEFVRVFRKYFQKTFDLDKLLGMTEYFSDMFDEISPDIVVVERSVPVRNSRALIALNQTVGMIVATAWNSGAYVNMVHNKSVKAHFGIKKKKDLVELIRKKYGIEDATDDECDAVGLVEYYKNFANTVDK